MCMNWHRKRYSLLLLPLLLLPLSPVLLLWQLTWNDTCRPFGFLLLSSKLSCGPIDLYAGSSPSSRYTSSWPTRSECCRHA